MNWKKFFLMGLAIFVLPALDLVLFSHSAFGQDQGQTLRLSDVGRPISLDQVPGGALFATQSAETRPATAGVPLPGFVTKQVRDGRVKFLFTAMDLPAGTYIAPKVRFPDGQQLHLQPNLFEYDLRGTTVFSIWETDISSSVYAGGVLRLEILVTGPKGTTTVSSGHGIYTQFWGQPSLDSATERSETVISPSGIQSRLILNLTGNFFGQTPQVLLNLFFPVDPRRVTVTSNTMSVDISDNSFITRWRGDYQVTVCAAECDNITFRHIAQFATPSPSLPPPPLPPTPPGVGQ